MPDAPTLPEIGQTVTAPVGTGKRRRLATGTVTKVEDRGTWGGGMRPWNATPETRLFVVSVDLGGRLGVRDYSSTLVHPLED